MDLWEEEDSKFWGAVRNQRTFLPAKKGKTFDRKLPILGFRSPRTTERLPWSVEQETAARSFLAKDRSRASRIEEAIRRPHARFIVDYSLGLSASFPHVGELKIEAKRIQVSCLLYVTEDEPQSAVACIENLVQLSETLRDEPVLISQFVRISILRQAINCMEELLNNNENQSGPTCQINIDPKNARSGIYALPNISNGAVEFH